MNNLGAIQLELNKLLDREICELSELERLVLCSKLEEKFDICICNHECYLWKTEADIKRTICKELRNKHIITYTECERDEDENDEELKEVFL